MKTGKLLMLLLFAVSLLPTAAYAHDRNLRKQNHKTSDGLVVSLATVCPEVQSFKLDGNQEVPPTGSSAVGGCVGLLQADRTNITVTCTHNVVDANAAHIHLGPVGVVGPIVCPALNADNPLTISCNLDSTLRAALEAGSLYVNVHSPTFPNGEIRGQIPVPLTACSSSSSAQSSSSSSVSSVGASGTGDSSSSVMTTY